MCHINSIPSYLRSATLISGSIIVPSILNAVI